MNQDLERLYLPHPAIGGAFVRGEHSAAEKSSLSFIRMRNSKPSITNW